MPINTYDTRPTEEIREILLHTPREDIDLLDVCVVLCERVARLEKEVNWLDRPKKD